MELQVKNVKLVKGIPAEEYFAMPGISFSSTKVFQKIEPTPKMRFGSLVDAYLFEPDTYNGEQYVQVKKCAVEIKKALGIVYSKGEYQMAVFADFIYNGLKISYKGRIDLLSTIVVDLKCSDLKILDAVKFFRYDRQLSGYCIATGRTQGLIMSVHPHKASIQSFPIIPDDIFWREIVLKFGIPV